MMGQEMRIKKAHLMVVGSGINGFDFPRGSKGVVNGVGRMGDGGNDIVVGSS